MNQTTPRSMGRHPVQHPYRPHRSWQHGAVAAWHGLIVFAGLTAVHFFWFVVAYEPFPSTPDAFKRFVAVTSDHLPAVLAAMLVAFLPVLVRTALGSDRRFRTAREFRRGTIVLSVAIFCTAIAMLHGFRSPVFPLSLLSRSVQLAIGENMLLVSASFLVLVIVVIVYWFLPLIQTCTGYLRQRRPTAHCPECDYDLAGIAAGVCPECGAVLRQPAAPDSAAKAAIAQPRN